MQAVEAMQHLLTLGDAMTAPPAEGTERVRPRTEEEQERDSLAIAVIQAMLNTALPVARFRAFVQIDNIPGSQEGQEFTVCAVSASDLQSGLRHLGVKKPIDLQASLWEQRVDGAEMLSGYQGPTGPRYRKWLDSLSSFEEGVSVQ